MSERSKRLNRNFMSIWRHLRHLKIPIVATAFLLMTDQSFAQYNQYQASPLAPFLFSLGLWRPPTASDIFERFAIDALAALFGFLIGAFFSPLLRPFRRLVFFTLVAATVLSAWFGYAPFGGVLSRIIAIFAFFVALGYGLQLGAKAFLKQRHAAERPISYGSAQWASHAHVHENGLLRGHGFLLGSFIESGRRLPIHYDGPRHLLTVAPTRSGKGVSSIIPNLLTYEGAAFIIDPKGENSLVTALRRGPGDATKGISGLGQQIYLLDPWNIAASRLGMTAAHFNPLDWITADDVDAVENAFLLAEALVPSGAQGEAKFWDDETKSLLCGIILFVATAESEAGNRHLGRVRDILLLGETEFKSVLETMYNEKNPVVSGTASRTASKDPKLRSNVLASAQSHTHFLDSPRIRENLSRSDFRFEDLKTTPMTVYLILPADRLETFGRWLRVLIQQAITINARNIGVTPVKPVLFLLDEMAALGRLGMVEQAFGLMAGFGIQLWGIVQDLSQLERIYDKGWQTFISNSGVIQYFGSRDKITAEYFSTLCGVTTVRITNLSYTIGKAFSRTWSSVTGANGGSSSSGGSTSDSYSDTIATNESQRQLAYPDELMVLKHNQQIIFVENLDPIRAEKFRWFDDPALQRLGVNLRAAATQAIEQKKPSLTDKTPDKSQQIETIEIDDPDFGLIPVKIYSDKTAEIETTEGPHRFASLAELNAYLTSARADLRKGK